MQICVTYHCPANTGSNRRWAAQRATHPVRKVIVMSLEVNQLVVKGKLVSAEQLLDELFDPKCKPSLRWLRSQTKARAIPFIRIGHLVFFDLEMVRSALAGKRLVRHRMSAPAVQTAA